MKPDIPEYFQPTVEALEAIVKDIQGQIYGNYNEMKVRMLIWQIDRSENPDKDYIIECLKKIYRLS